jgi:hypothetical protein
MIGHITQRLLPRPRTRSWAPLAALAATLLGTIPAAAQDAPVRIGSGAVVGRTVQSHTDIPAGFSRLSSEPAVELTEQMVAANIQFIVPPTSSSEITLTVWCEIGGSRYYAKDFAVIRIYAKNVGYPSSGHSHGPQGRPAGKFTPELGYGRDYKFTADYERGPVSGDEIIVYRYVIIDENLPEQCRGIEAETEVPGAIRVHGLTPILGARWLWLEPTQTPHYGGTFYGVPGLQQRLVRMSEEYFNIARHSLRLNAASLVHGGLFDQGGNWSEPFQGLRTGREALLSGDPRRPNTPALLVEAGNKAGLACTPTGPYQVRCSIP